ncbi:MAG TPA: hypothetical protein [Caudoviricetes sp.]|jgi:hypothetical protein|nr:MAG TPA: hypothetical protein [Caudoviricetes sp.]
MSYAGESVTTKGSKIPLIAKVKFLLFPAESVQITFTLIEFEVLAGAPVNLIS